MSIRKECPRCGRIFECKPDDILNCQCTKVNLSKSASELIAKHYNDCLCFYCLKEINENEKI